MPNRILRDWTDSETIDTLDVNAERFFTRLIMKVDDFGRYYSNVKLLRSTLYPLKSEIRDTDIARWLTACETAGLIAVYVIGSKGYLQINNFRQTLRQKTEKYPPPAIATQTHSNSIADVTPERKRNEVETNPNPEGEVEGKNFHPPSQDSDSDFQQDPKSENKKEKISGKKGKGHGFDQSPYFDRELFRFELSKADPPYCNADPDYYYEALLQGWKSKGYVYLDWFATAQNWIRRDVSDARFKAKFSQPHSIKDEKQSNSRNGFATKSEQISQKNRDQFNRLVGGNKGTGTE
jgi:hypothetical protein